MVTLLGDWAGNVVTCGRLKDPPVELEDPYKTNTFTYIYMKMTLFLNNINQRSISININVMETNIYMAFSFIIKINIFVTSFQQTLFFQIFFLNLTRCTSSLTNLTVIYDCDTDLCCTCNALRDLPTAMSDLPNGDLYWQRTSSHQ